MRPVKRALPIDFARQGSSQFLLTVLSPVRTGSYDASLLEPVLTGDSRLGTEV